MPARESVFVDDAGSQWDYQRFDSLTGAADTVRIRVVGPINGSGGRTGVVWNRGFRQFDARDTIWVDEVETVVLRSDYAGGSFHRTTYRNVLLVGTRWRDPVDDSWSEVVAESLLYPLPPFDQSGSYSAIWRAYRVREDWARGSSAGMIETWMTPGFGIHRIHRIETGDAPANESWRLISYNHPDRQ
jgi:hypothetical protein